MAKIIWTGPATNDVREIVEYIALENPVAARSLAQRIEHHVVQLERYPYSGSYVPEMAESGIRQLIEPPCRIFYRVDRKTVYILHVLRFERLLRLGRLQEWNE